MLPDVHRVELLYVGAWRGSGAPGDPVRQVALYYDLGSAELLACYDPVNGPPDSVWSQRVARYQPARDAELDDVRINTDGPAHRVLIAYINGLDRAARESFERSVGTSIGYLRKASSIGQVPRAALCVAIERATGGAITRRALRADDWWRIWPELVTDEFPIPANTTEESATS